MESFQFQERELLHAFLSGTQEAQFFIECHKEVKCFVNNSDDARSPVPFASMAQFPHMESFQLQERERLHAFLSCTQESQLFIVPNNSGDARSPVTVSHRWLSFQ